MGVDLIRPNGNPCSQRLPLEVDRRTSMPYSTKAGHAEFGGTGSSSVTSGSGGNIRRQDKTRQIYWSADTMLQLNIKTHKEAMKCITKPISHM